MGQHLEYLQSQFALVGDKADKTVLVKDGPSDFLLYVSGRRNVQYGHWWIKVIGWIMKLTVKILIILYASSSSPEATLCHGSSTLCGL